MLSVWWCEIPDGVTVGGYGYQPPEWYVPCGVFVAETRGQAKAMLIASDNDLDAEDYLRVRTRRLGVPNRREAVPGSLGDRSRWWGRVPVAA